MARVTVLWDKFSDTRPITSGSWVAGLSLANLKTQDVQQVARSTDATAANTKWRLDGGAAKAWNMFVFKNMNLTTSATIRIVVTSDASDTASGSRVHDSGNITVYAGTDTSGYPGGSVWYYYLSSAVTARYVWVYITDTGNPDGYVQVGRFIAATAWSPGVNVNVGLQRRWVDPSPVQRTPYGRRLTLPLPKYREIDMEFGFLSETEANTTVEDINADLGVTSDLFLVEDTAAPAALGLPRCYYAAIKETQPIVDSGSGRYSWRLTLEELT